MADATTTDPLSAIPSWVFLVGLGVAAWMTYDAISPMVAARRRSKKLAAPRRSVRSALGYYVYYDSSPGHVTQGPYFDTRGEAQDWVRTKLSPKRRPKIVREDQPPP